MVTPLPHPPPGTPAGEMPLELQELAEDYVIEGEVGRGGSAVVYRARERTLDRVVAIKVIRAPYVGDDDLVARLEREARLVARLDHPNVVALLGVRRLRHGSLALVMRYVRGHTLRAELQRRGALPVARAEAVVRDVGHALAAAHAHGIVHRDVKPENIHIEHGGQRALLADFGAATPLRGDLRLTVAGMSIGTPGYMAPELIDGADATPSSDVYGLGLVAWEMLTGRAPWEGDSLFAVLTFRKHGRLAELDTVRADVPPTVAAAVAGALHPDPTKRWPDVHRFLEEFARPAPRRWLSVGGATQRRAPLFIPPPIDDDDAAGRPASPVADQPTVRLTRPAEGSLPVELPPVEPTGSAPAPGIPGVVRAAPETPHPSAAVFAVDDEADFELFEADSRSSGRWPRRLAILAVLLVTVAAAGVARYMSIADRPIATVAEADGDVPASFTLPVVPPAGTRAEPAPAGAGTDATDSALSAPPQMPAAVRSTPSPSPADARAVSPSSSDAGQPTDVASAGAADTRPAAESVRPSAPARIPVASPTAPPPVPSPPVRSSAGTMPVEAPVTRAPAPPSPAPTGPAATSRAVATRLGLGGLHSCAILGDGRLRCWGADEKGQLGSASSSVHFTTVVAGVTHSCGRSTAGQTLCWGANERGQLGDGTRTTHDDPRPVTGSGDQVELAMGASHSCALTRGGGVECWGANDAGQLGTGDHRDRSAPAPVAATGPFTAVAAGWRHSCALASDGRALCWGDNGSGQLGDGTTESRDQPTVVNSSLRFRALAAGRAHSCGLTTAGELYCWGGNGSGQLGTGSRRDAATPRRVGPSGSVRGVVAGSMHSCVLTTDGGVSCWGQNRYGQLGDGTTIDRDTPVRVLGLPRVAELEASGAHSCGRTSAGDVYCWGYNLYGQLGDGTRQNRLRPVAVTIPP